MMWQGRMLQPQPLPSSTMAMAGAAAALTKESATRARSASFLIGSLPSEVSPVWWITCPVSTQLIKYRALPGDFREAGFDRAAPGAPTFWASARGNLAGGKRALIFSV